MSEIKSRLWKINLLSLNSTYFPRMVQAAAWYHNKPYSDEMLQRVAATPELINALTVTTDASIDEVLTGLASDPETAVIMDNLILNAVASYVPGQ